MKGVAVADLVYLLLEYVVIMVIVVVVVFLNIRANLNPFDDPLAFSVHFTKASTEPFTLAEGASRLMIADRATAEHALEAALAGSLDRSLSAGIATPLAAFFGAYGHRFYSVEIRNADATILSLNSIENRCGPALEGACVLTTATSLCPAGQRRIDDRQDICDESNTISMLDDGTPISHPKEVCCTVDPAATVARCGPAGQKLGVCDAPRDGACPSGRLNVEAEKNDCASGAVCCVDAALDEAQSVGATAAATAPLLYRGVTLYEPATYDCKDSTTSSCSGEYVSGLCSGGSNIKCCVPAPVRCEPSAPGWCMDETHCPSGAKTIEGACPGPPTYTCCVTADPYHETAAGDDPTTFGACTLGGSAYYGEPFVGAFEVVVG